jgi:inner membrane protein
MERKNLMIFFGHIGPTTVMIKAYDKLTQKENREAIDYRFVVVGSILPDLIDKPIGDLFFRKEFENTRLFAHTLLFSSLLMIIGLFLMIKNRKRSSKFFLLGICSFIHQLLDSMWLYPKTFYWPFLGWKFPTRPEGNWLMEGMGRLLTDPSYFIAEIVGAIIVAFFVVRLIKNKKVNEFLKTGIL